MAHFIKPTFWESLKKGYRGYLNLDDLIKSVIVAPYKVYTALLTQRAEESPTAIVLENTLGGGLIWTRTHKGNYQTVVPGIPPNAKVAIIFGGPTPSPVGVSYQYSYSSGNGFLYIISIANYSGGSAVRGQEDFLFQSTAVEIRVYN